MMFNFIKNNYLTRKIILAILRIFSIINLLIPKKDNQILFYDNSRKYLDDNTEALYNWLRNNGYDKKYKLICCVPMYQKDNILINYKPIGIVKGIWFYLKSKYVFYSFGDFRIKPSDKQIVVNLWHGTPIKCIANLTMDGTYKKEKIDNFTYLIVASNNFIEIMSKAFLCKKNKIKVLGNARNDYLFSTNSSLGRIGVSRDKYNKCILWMPTFRLSKDGRYDAGVNDCSETLLPIIYTMSQLKKLNQYLLEKKILLVIKIHPLAKFSRVSSFKNIKIIVNDDLIPNGIKLYEFVKDFDALITDYSSIYCDYLLLDRPIGFTLDDYEIYEDKRGFVFDNVTDYMPGHHIYNLEDMYQFIDDIVNENDKYKEHRRELLPFFNKFTDGNNCKRLVDELGITLIEK